MACPPRDITDTELAILQALWDRGSSSTRQLTDGLYPNGTAAQYATVQSLLNRLEEKGFVSRDRERRVHVFSAAVAREDVIDRRLRSLAEQLCEGSLSPLLTHLVGAQKLTPKEREELRALLDSKAPAPRKKGKQQGKQRG